MRAKIRESHQKVKVLKDEHMKKVNEYRKYQKRLYELRQVERKKEWEARQEEKKKRSDEFKEEYADILKDPCAAHGLYIWPTADILKDPCAAPLAAFHMF